jgi:hypothetical protein
MKKYLLIAALFSSSAFAATAFYTGENVTGLTKQCYYKFAGSTYTKTIKSHQVCPTSIQV